MAATRWRLHLEKPFANLAAAALSTDHQRDYRRVRVAAGAARATINRELQIIRRAFKLAAEHEPRPKVSKVPRFLIDKEDNARKEFITREQAARLLQAASEESLWARVFVELLYVLGWRKGEVRALRVRDFNVADGTVRIETSKSGKPRECPLTPALTTMMKQLVSGRDADERVFPEDPRYMWERIKEAAKVPNAVMHDFRRTSAREKRAHGVDTTIIMAQQGWESPAMLKRYAIVDLEDQREGLKPFFATRPTFAQAD